MYKNSSQLRIEDFVFPYGRLNQENDWVKLAQIVPWETIEEGYAAQFVNNGHPAHPSRTAFGALVVKQRMKCSDEWVVKHISENPYLQYFIGMKEYSSKCPFGKTTMVAFRTRFSPEDIARILEATIPEPRQEKAARQETDGAVQEQGAEQDSKNGGNDDQNRPNGGTLIVSASDKM